MDTDIRALIPVFLSEAEGSLDTLEEALLRLEISPDDSELLGTAFRCVHTVKGNAESFGFDAVASCAHALEGVLDMVRKGFSALTSARVSLMLQAIDAIRAMLRIAALGDDPTSIDALCLSDRLAAAALGRAFAAPPSPGAPAAPADQKKTVRVNLQTLDLLMTLTGELSTTRAELREHAFDELREQVVRLRLVPLGPMLRAQARAVRDLAAAHGKRAKVVIGGDDVEVDTAVVEALRDPIVHMVRNALDHGIEPPAVRVAMGKDPTGTITLNARHEGARIVIEVRDDGAGLPRDRIMERARAMGFISDGAALSDAEVDRLIFAPGFSTAAQVTELSGRGIGMDVVSRNVSALRGTIAVTSARGLGTTITVRVPLTLAIIDSFSIAAAGETYVIPLDAVRGCADVPEGERRHQAGRGIIHLSGEVLPYLRVRDFFALPGPRPDSELVVIVEHEGLRAGLAVDELHGEGKSVVKPLCKLFQRIVGITGTTILGDGKVALILDVPAILHEAAKHNKRPGAPLGAA